MVVWYQFKVCGSRQPTVYRLYIRSVTKSATAAAVCGLWRYISVIYYDLYCVEWGVKLYSLTHSPS